MYFTQDRQFKILSIFIIILPIFLITGPALSDFTVISLAIVYLFLLSNNNFSQIIKNKTIVLLLAFYFILIVSSLFSVDISHSLKSTIPYIRFLLFSLALYLILKKYQSTLLNFLFVICLANIIIFAGSLYEFVFDTNILGADKIFKHRISSFFGDEYIMGSYTSRLLPLIAAVYFMCKIKNKKFTLMFWISFIFGVLNVIFIGERTALLYLFIFIIPFIICYTSKSIFRKIVNMLILSISFFLIIYLNPGFKKRYIDLTISQFKNEKTLIFSEEHTQIYKTAYKIFIDFPILGSGPNTYRLLYNNDKYYSGKHSVNTHPHNTYLQIISEVGLAGVIIPILLLLVLLYNFLLEIFFKKTDLIKLCFYSSFIITLLPIIPSGNFFNNYLSIIYYLPLGFYFYYKKI